MAEYRVLSLIEETSPFIKVATILCAVSLLAVLESEHALRRRHRNAFRIPALSVCALYSLCVSFAGYTAWQKSAVKAHLDRLYSMGIAIGSDQPDFNREDVGAAFLENITSREKSWETETYQYLQSEVSASAAGRFTDASYATTQLSWVPSSMWQFPNALRYDELMTKAATRRRNLATIIESGAYVK